MSIQWNMADRDKWRVYLGKVSRLNLLQSEDYLRAMAWANQQRMSRGLITINGQEAGVCCVLEAGVLNNALHGVILDRGPLWFDGYGSATHFDEFVRMFVRRYPHRFGRRMRFIPEYEDTPFARQVMRENGFKPVGVNGYETIWLDLRPDEEVLRKNLNPKWRNKLNQSEKRSLEIVWSDAGVNSMSFKWLVAQYLRDKDVRKYDGPSYKTINSLAVSFSRGKNMMIGVALLDKHPIAGILLFIHGASATYQIGYTSEEGREGRAHYALLWDAVGKLKQRHVLDFDLGGVNAKGAQGVKTFKKGMGGTIEKTLGLYRG